MSTKINEIKLDIEELNKLLQEASRQRCKDVLSLEIRKLQAELANLGGESVAPQTKTTCASNSSKKCYEVKLNNYGWDQTNTSVKLYVSLKNVHQLPKEAVTCNFTEKSMELRILGLDNKNYSLTITNLCEDIDANESGVKVKTDMVIVSLGKKVAKTWSHVTGVEKRIKDAKTASTNSLMEDTKDPDASIMNLLKKVYDEGNDEMKRSITKAWTETQQKREQGIID